MKVISFTRVHYGADYLDAVIRSTQGFSQHHEILYTPVPTFGRTTDLPCPDGRNELYDIAMSADSRRARWHERIPVQPATVLSMHPDADIILELDADEVIQPELLQDIKNKYAAGALAAFSYRLPFVHHWRAFDYVCRDPGWPVRLYLPKNRGEDRDMYFPGGDNRSGAVIHHFGYARSLEDTRYKMAISMHIGEFRADWWDEIYLKFPERLKDLHPVCLNNFWDAEKYDKTDLPPSLHDHPYYDREVIE